MKLINFLYIALFSLFISGASGVNPAIVGTVLLTGSVLIEAPKGILLASITNVPTTNAGYLPLNELITDLVLGATTIERGLTRVIPNAQDAVEIPTFNVALDQLQAYAESPSTANDSIVKANIVIQNAKIQWFDTFNPVLNFENDYSSFWHSGKMTEAQLNAKIRTAMIAGTTKSVANNVEKCLWQGLVGGDAWLAFFDGWEKQLTDSSDVNKVTDLTVAITKANILDVLQALIDIAPDAVLELGSSKFVLSHRLKQIYFEASRDIAISKGINIFESGIPRFAGYEIVSTGISDNKIMFADCNSGSSSVLQTITWMTQDMSSAKIERTTIFSDLWGILYTFRLGNGLQLENQIQYYDGTVA